MAKEAELKSVDLKVSVNCCEGCKRKVLKALSTKGVLRAEIHPTLPKVTVIGNVDVGILIKKLSKVGKSAEVLSEETQKPQRDDGVSEKEKDKGKEPENDKSSSIDNGKSNESKSTLNKDEIGKDKEGEKNPVVVETTKGVYPTIVTTIPQMSLYQTIAPQAKVYYPVEPVVVPMPYYPMNADPAPAAFYIQDYRYYETPSYRHSPPQSQAMAALGDYFNEDNTVGCRIM
ncbi:heavy metal-associated isoprenylated plant protein 35-like [Zingiber officinale]|nr:heavy metal-associated isoprenylated plant protein 35-like [Zingiber officinale]